MAMNSTSLTNTSPWRLILFASLVVMTWSEPSSCEAATPTANVTGFRQHVQPLVQKYCIDCHGADDPEGELSLDAVDPNLLTGGSLETWRMIDEQVRFGDMPPDDADQPSQAERKRLLDWIRQEVRKTQLPGVVVDEKLMLPQFGNYVDHEALFGKRRPRVHPAPPRLWRLRPDIYDTTMPRLGEGIGGLANGLGLLDGPVFKDYAARYFIDEAATNPLLANAKKCSRISLRAERTMPAAWSAIWRRRFATCCSRTAGFWPAC